MKFLLAVLLLAPVTTFAAVPTELNCYEPNHAPDHAYNAIVRKLQEAQITESTLAGPRILARLNCHSVPPTHPERFETVTRCEGSRFTGYILTVTQTVLRGTTARLEQHVFPRGIKLLTTMVCR